MRSNKRQRADNTSKLDFKVSKKIKLDKDYYSHEAEEDFGEDLSQDNDSCMQSSGNSDNTPQKAEYGNEQFHESKV